MARISRLAVYHSPSVAAPPSPDVLVRQPPGTVSMLFHKVPVLQDPRAWRWAPLDLHLDVELLYASGLTGVDLFSDPVPGHQFIDVGHFVICDTRQNPTQPGFWIDTVHAAGLNEGIGNGSSVTAAL